MQRLCLTICHAQALYYLLRINRICILMKGKTKKYFKASVYKRKVLTLHYYS